MGIHDREYYRSEQSGGFVLGGPRTMVTNIIIVNAVVFLVTLFSGNNAFGPEGNVFRWLALDTNLFRPDLYVWKLLTYAFEHGGPWHLLVNMYILYVFGRDVEARYGRAEFLRLYLILAVFSGLIWLGVQYLVGTQGIVVGASGAVLGVLILYCFNYPHRTILLFFVLPVPAWLLAVLFVVQDIVAFMNNLHTSLGNHIANEAHLAGAGLGAAYYVFGWNFGFLWPRSTPSVKKIFKPKTKLRVHDPEDFYDDMDTKGDQVLQKLHEFGEDSLTSKERRILEDYSRRMRQKHR